MKKNVKIIIVLGCIIILFIGICLLVVFRNQDIEAGRQEEHTNYIQEEEKESYVEEIEDGIKINKSTKLNEAKQVEGFLISNIQLTTKDGMTTFLADVTNQTEQASDIKTVEIILLTQNNEELAKLTGIINALDKGETTQLNIALTSDYVEAYDFKVTIK